MAWAKVCVYLWEKGFAACSPARPPVSWPEDGARCGSESLLHQQDKGEAWSDSGRGFRITHLEKTALFTDHSAPHTLIPAHVHSFTSISYLRVSLPLKYIVRCKIFIFSDPAAPGRASIAEISFKFQSKFSAFYFWVIFMLRDEAEEEPSIKTIRNESELRTGMIMFKIVF